MRDWDCDCSEDYGPCERHGATVVMREGASVRTADESAVTFIVDARALGAELSPYGAGVLTRAEGALEANRRYGVAWLEDDALRDEVMTVMGQCETELSTLGFLSYWDDGYRIVKPSDDCPLTSDD